MQFLATVPGGFFNSAEGSVSFAAGVNAHAMHNGSFVWSDGTSSEATTGPNQFVARATGGFRFQYGSGPGDYCVLLNSTGWHGGIKEKPAIFSEFLDLPGCPRKWW